MSTETELIPGTALPYGGQASGEGRGSIERYTRSQPLLERLADRDDIAPHELAIVAAALRAYEHAPKFEKTVFEQHSGQADATTGNLVLELHAVPQGMEGHIAQVTYDTPQVATINPSAPFANAASWSFLAVASRGYGQQNANADALRAAMVAFAPSSAAGPIVPGQWTFNDSNAPVAFGGESVYLVVHGGSQAALAGAAYIASIRLNLFSRT